LAQIEEKRYFEKYLHQNKPITLVGIMFDSEKKNVAGWVRKDLV